MLIVGTRALDDWNTHTRAETSFARTSDIRLKIKARRRRATAFKACDRGPGDGAGRMRVGVKDADNRDR